MALPPQTFTAGKVVPSPVSVTTGWYLLGADELRLGPFTLAELIEWAKQNRVTEATPLWHQVASGGVWVPAGQLALIAEHIADVAPSASSVDVRPGKKGRRRSTGFKIARDVVAPGLATCSLFLGYQHYTDGPLQLPRFRNEETPKPVATTSPEPTEQASVRSREPLRVKPRLSPRAPEPTPRGVTEPELAAPAPKREVAAVRGRNDGNLANLLKPAQSPSERVRGTNDAMPSEAVSLNLGSGRQIAELSQLNTSEAIKLVRAEGFPATTIIESPSGRISESVATWVKPFGDESIYLIVKRLGGNTTTTKLSIECKTSLDWLGGDDLSAERLKRKRVAMQKQLMFLSNNRMSAANEGSKLDAFLKNKTPKRLQDVQTAKKRITFLQESVKALDTQIAAGQLQISQFDTFCERLNSTFADTKLVFQQPIGQVAQSEIELADTEMGPVMLP